MCHHKYETASLYRDLTQKKNALNSESPWEGFDHRRITPPSWTDSTYRSAFAANHNADVTLGPVHTSNIVEATFDFVATNGNNVERFYCKISSVRQCLMLLDIVASVDRALDVNNVQSKCMAVTSVFQVIFFLYNNE